VKVRAASSHAAQPESAKPIPVAAPTEAQTESEIAAAFHEAVAAGAAAACADAGSPRTAALSGGSFQNLRLLDSTRRSLEQEGFRVLAHRLVPPNDGGISYGQAVVAAASR
jgi:hydrogenase maturation protein HypF